MEDTLNAMLDTEAERLCNASRYERRLKEFESILSDMARQLADMDRCERRALSRRKFAIRAFETARRQAASARE